MAKAFFARRMIDGWQSVNCRSEAGRGRMIRAEAGRGWVIRDLGIAADRSMADSSSEALQLGQQSPAAHTSRVSLQRWHSGQRRALWLIDVML
jgi:hypothetical protein